jgi:hypothetical protein
MTDRQPLPVPPSVVAFVKRNRITARFDRLDQPADPESAAWAGATYYRATLERRYGFLGLQGMRLKTNYSTLPHVEPTTEGLLIVFAMDVLGRQRINPDQPLLTDQESRQRSDTLRSFLGDELFQQLLALAEADWSSFSPGR